MNTKISFYELLVLLDKYTSQKYSVYPDGPHYAFQLSYFVLFKKNIVFLLVPTHV